MCAHARTYTQVCSIHLDVSDWLCFFYFQAYVAFNIWVLWVRNQNIELIQVHKYLSSFAKSVLNIMEQYSLFVFIRYQILILDTGAAVHIEIFHGFPQPKRFGRKNFRYYNDVCLE